MANLDRVHPELMKRFNRLVELCWERAWYVGITSATRSYEEQWSLYRAYLRGSGNLAANPDQAIGESPWGWTVHGSYHMVQGDGYSHALDLHWQQCTAKQLEAAANLVGLRLTVPGEDWHFQWWDTNEIFTPLLPEPLPRYDEEDDEMTPVIHKPTKREGSPVTSDFSFLPADTSDSPVGGYACTSRLILRRNGGADRGCTVYFNGVPTSYEVPEDGRSLVIKVAADGLCSVIGDVIAEAREQWRKV